MSGRSSLPWIPAYGDLGDHPKLWRLMATLTLDEATAVGHLMYLWWWVKDYAPDGDLSAFSDLEIARAARWRDTASAFVDALQVAGFLTAERKINDWDEYAGGELERRHRDAERKRQERSADVHGMSADVPRMSSVEKRRVEKRREDKSLGASPRKRDELFETVAEVCGINWRSLTPTARGTLNRATAELREVGATPDEVRLRAGRYRSRYDTGLTPMALAKHWPGLDHDEPRGRSTHRLDMAYRDLLAGGQT